MRTNYVLIDFENVQPESLVGLQQDHFNLQGAVERGFHWQVVDGNLLAQNRRFT